MTELETQHEPISAEITGGWFYTWWKGDPLPPLPALPDLRLEPTSDHGAVAALAHLPVEDVLKRVASGHLPYLAWMGDSPAAYGWSATREASIGEHGLHFLIPAGDRYLWDFVTLPGWRGGGIYPRLLQFILLTESSEAERFWIGHDADNSASARGILKAGFQRVVGMDADGEMSLKLVGPMERVSAAAQLLGIHLDE